MDFPKITWRKSRHSGGGGNNCVEVARLPGRSAQGEFRKEDLSNYKYANPPVEALKAKGGISVS